jgi:hypothetical protein
VGKKRGLDAQQTTAPSVIARIIGAVLFVTGVTLIIRTI